MSNIGVLTKPQDELPEPPTITAKLTATEWQRIATINNLEEWKREIADRDQIHFRYEEGIIESTAVIKPVGQSRFDLECWVAGIAKPLDFINSDPFESLLKKLGLKVNDSTNIASVSARDKHKFSCELVTS